MVLCPLGPSEQYLPGYGVARTSPVLAWTAVEKKQKQPAQQWWLIAQPDHAALSGDLAAYLDSDLIPKLEASVIRAIGLHDSGWARFDGGERGTARDLEVSLRDPQLDESGKPLSFLEMKPAEFLTAWTDSIEWATEAAPIGGVIISEHFCRIAKGRLESRVDHHEDTQIIQGFLERETVRQCHLLQHHRHSAQEVEVLVDVLQFCDLLSLYVCCGADDYVEFPQKFKGCTVRLHRQGEMYSTEPSLFGEGVSLGVTARAYPRFGAVEVTTRGFLLQ